jgi:hypothetical protein
MGPDLTEAGFTDWLERYKRAWETQAPDAATAIFTRDGTYRETPFDPPMEGREDIGDYWRTRVEANQTRVNFNFTVLAVNGDTGLARWSSRFDWLPAKQRWELDGIFKCRFRLDGPENGLCYQIEEWWHRRAIGPAGAA